MLTIYKASAGSGKTYTLAFQYIKILLAYFEPQEAKEELLYLHSDQEGGGYNPVASAGGTSDNTTLDHTTLCGEGTQSAYNADNAIKANNANGTFEDPHSESVSENSYHEKGRWRLYGPKGPRSRHRNILAVTFTHKATEEMKNRIIKELRQIVNTAQCEPGKRSDYANKLLQLTGCTPEQLKQTAQRALDDLLYDFHFFNVSTIDSFFQQVLRGFAREIAKNEDFALEIDNTVAVTMGVDSMLNSINTDDAPVETKSLANFIEQWMRSEYRSGKIGNMFNRNASIYRKLVKFVEATMSEEFKVYSDDVIHYLKDDPSRFERFRSAVNARFNDIPEQTKRLAMEALNLLSTSTEFVKSNIKSDVTKILQKLAGPASGYVTQPYDLDTNTWWKDTPQYVEAALNDPIGIFKKDYSKKTSEVPQPLCQVIAKTFEAVIQGVKERRWLKSITSLLNHFGVLVSALEFIMQYRQDNNLILLSDTNELLQKVINDQDAPFIYEKLGNILEYYLIDEFQDTSRLQWDNLRPLVDNSISQGKEDLIIGDEKQSIYRFRNADAELLHHEAQKQIGPENCTIRGDQPGENTNYRSAPAVVRFNNALFAFLGKKLKSSYFENVVQDIPQKNRNKRGHVRFDVIPASKKADYVSMVLPRLVTDIRSLKQRGYGNGDIVILVRTREEGNLVVEHLLQQNDPGIVVSSDESLKLTMCPSVRVIVSALRLFTQQREPDPDASVDSDLEMRINEVEFLNSEESDISRAVEAVVNGTKKGFDKLNSVIGYRSSNLFTLTERIIQDILSPQMRQRDYSYIMAFQDYVTKFCSQFTSNVRKFLRWWDINEKKLTVAASPNVEAIRVMTIHKSKGLEFKCVLLPFTDVGVKESEELWVKSDPLKGLPNIKVDPQDLPPLLRIQGSSALNSKECPFYEDYLNWRQNQKTDMLNVGYVAFTRAENELIGYIKGKPQKKSASSDKAKKTKKATEATDGAAATETTSDVMNIGDLLIEAFQNVDSVLGTDQDAQSKESGKDSSMDSGKESCEDLGKESGKDTGTASEVNGQSDQMGMDELYYCQNPQERIPLTMPLQPYYGQTQYTSAEDYIDAKGEFGLEQESECLRKEAGFATQSEPGTESSTIQAIEALDEESSESEPFIIERFEYGEPTHNPALEPGEEEKTEAEPLTAAEEEKLQKEFEDEARFRSPLERISIGEYTPTFPKNVEHYFTVDEDEDTFEEENIASEEGDCPTEGEGLPGGFDRQLWGEILHRAMSYIHDKVDAESAIARVSRQFQMDDAAYQYLCRRVWETLELDHPRVRLWFDRRKYESVVTERPIYEPTTLATYRPDRIVWYEDGSADIIDYKFGVQFSEDYNLQMKKYIELVEYMGVPNVRGFIYFPTSKKIKEFHKKN